MFKLVNETYRKDSVPVFKVLLQNPIYNINNYLSRGTVSSTVPSVIDSKVSQYAYVDSTSTDLESVEFRLVYTSMYDVYGDYKSAYLETIYGSLIPKHLYTSKVESDHLIVYAKEGILTMGPILLRYDTEFINNDFDLVNWDLVTSSVGGISVDPQISLLYQPRVNLLGTDNIYKNHNIYYPEFVYSDGINWYANSPSIYGLSHVPVKIYKNYILFPVDVSFDTNPNIFLNFDSIGFTNIQYEVMLDAYDKYNKVGMIRGIFSQIPARVLQHNTGVRASYYTKGNIDSIELNPVFSNGTIGTDLNVRSEPIDIYMMGNVISSADSILKAYRSNTVLSSAERDLLNMAIRVSTIYYNKEGDEPIIINQIRESTTTFNEPELMHYCGYASIDGIMRDLSSVMLFEIPYYIYEETVIRFRDYSNDADLDATNYIRNLAYDYAPIGKFIVIEFVDDTRKVIKRII